MASRATRERGSLPRLATRPSTGSVARSGSSRRPSSSSATPRPTRVATTWPREEGETDGIDDRLQADLHVLPPGARAGGAGRAHLAHPRRADHARDRARLPGPEPTLAQRLVRAKRKIRDAGIPYRSRRGDCCRSAWTPSCASCTSIFNEGYSATRGRRADPARAVGRGDPARPGSRELLPDEPESLGLLALMLLHDARREARTDDERPARAARVPGPGALGPRRDRRGQALLDRAMRHGRPGAYQVQAAIARCTTGGAAGGDRVAPDRRVCTPALPSSRRRRSSS
jgi:hypothetical protein